MAETKFIRFNERQEKAALDLLERLPDDSMADGEELWMRDAVERLWWETPNVTLHAEVRDRKRHLVSFLFSPNEILNVACSCKRGSMCKHAAAVLLTAGDGPVDFDDHEDEDDFSSPVAPPPLKPAAPPAAAAASPPPSSSPPELVTVPPSPLAAYLIKRTGQPINRREAELVAKIEAIWRQQLVRLSLAPRRWRSALPSPPTVNPPPSRLRIAPSSRRLTLGSRRRAWPR